MKSAFTLHSPETGTEYVIHVGPDTDPTAGPMPAVLFMDGDDQFSAAVDAYRQLRRNDSVPPLALIGVGYGASYAKPANKRGRDYTPTAHSDEPTSGGADVFLTFLRNTLWPELERRYPLHANIRGIAGHSLGSLLVLHALWREPLFFTHYLASAPSIWWDHRSILRIAEQRRAHSAVLPAHLFLCVGEDDSASMTGDLALLERQLAANPFRSLVIDRKLFTGRNHYDVLPDAFRQGLEILFRAKPAAKSIDR